MFRGNNGWCKMAPAHENFSPIKRVSGARPSGLWVGLALALLLLLTAACPSVQAAGGGAARVVESDTRHVVMDMETPAYVTQTQELGGQTFLELRVPGWNVTHEARKPQLPTYSALLAIPQNVDVSVKVLEDETRHVTLSQPILPVATVRADYTADITMPPPILETAADAGAYHSTENYPPGLAEISAPAQWRSQRYLTLTLNPFEYAANAKELLVHDHLRVEIRFTLQPQADATQADVFGGQMDEGAFETIFNRSFLNYDSATAWRKPNHTAQGGGQNASPANKKGSYKIAVNQDGLYQLNCAALTKAGMALGQIALGTLKIENQNRELALDVRDKNSNDHCDKGDTIRFWATAATTMYTDTNVYWLTYGGAAGKRMDVRTETGSGTPSAVFTDTLKLEENKYFIGFLPWVEDADHWWWMALPSASDPDGNGDPNSADFHLSTARRVANTAATLRVALGAVSTGNHHTRILVNGNLLYDEQWAGVTTRDVVITVPTGLLVAGDNIVRVVELIPAPNYIWVNTLALDFASSYGAQDNALRFTQANTGTWSYAIPGFSQQGAVVYDTTDPFDTARVSATSVKHKQTYTARFTDQAAGRRDYIALTKKQFKKPLSITKDKPSQLHKVTNGADYIIITHADFKASVKPLADWRATQDWGRGKLRVKVVDVQDVYDEFSGGVFDAQAIHDFLDYAYRNWRAPRPAYVLLMGNGNLNLRNYPDYPLEAQFIPPYMKLVDPWIGMTASDHRLVTLDAGSELPSMAIGRLPVLTTTEADAVVSKILAYEQNPPDGAWRKDVLFVADNPDAAGNFYALSNLIADDSYYMPPPMVGNKVYFPSGKNAQVKQGLNAGQLIINYVGHGAVAAWGENLLTNGNAASLTNGDKLFFMLPMTCYDGYFHFPKLASVSEAMVTRANGGAIASWSPTGLGVATQHDQLDRGVFEAVMEKNIHRIGDAIVYSKTKLLEHSGHSDLMDTYNLLGDPATQLAVGQ